MSFAPAAFLSGGGWNLGCRSVRHKVPLAAGRGDTKGVVCLHVGQGWEI